MTATRLPAADDRGVLRDLNRRMNDDLASAVDLIAAGAVLAENPEVKATLSSVVEVLRGYSDVHRALMLPACRVLVDAAEYLRELGYAISRSWLGRLNIHLVFAADTLPLEADRCWRLGLAVNELVANSARDASFDSQHREIRIELRRSGRLANCAVSDHQSSSAGVRQEQGFGLVRDLSKSLGGRIERHSESDNRSFLLLFALTEREQRANATVVRCERRAARRRRTARPAAQLTMPAREPENRPSHFAATSIS